MVTSEKIKRGWCYHWQNQIIEVSHGGSLLAWQYHHTPRLYVSPLSQPQQRLRGGLPICWPWFGAGATGLPPHGFLQDSQFPQPQCTSSNTKLELTLRHTFQVEESMTDVTIVYQFTDSGAVTVCCHICNCSDSELIFDLGLHPYFSVPQGMNTLTLVMADKTTVLPDAIDEKRPLIDGALTIQINGNNWLTLNSNGFDQLGIWRINEQKARAIKDLPDDAHNRFFCLEPLSMHVTLHKGQQRSWQSMLCWHHPECEGNP